MKILRLMKRYIVLYVMLQVATGVEVGLTATGLVIFGGVSLPVALAVTIPMGFPLLLLQAWFALAWIHNDRGEVVSAPAG